MTIFEYGIRKMTDKEKKVALAALYDEEGQRMQAERDYDNNPDILKHHEAQAAELAARLGLGKKATQGASDGNK